jgi:hypothetical protein
MVCDGLFDTTPQTDTSALWMKDVADRVFVDDYH